MLDYKVFIFTLNPICTSYLNFGLFSKKNILKNCVANEKNLFVIFENLTLKT